MRPLNVSCWFHKVWKRRRVLPPPFYRRRIGDKISLDEFFKVTELATGLPKHKLFLTVEYAPWILYYNGVTDLTPPWRHTRLSLGRHCCGICHSGLFQNLCVLVAQSCLTLCDPMDCSLAGSSVHGILQARILEWVVIPFSRGSSGPRDWTCISCIAGGFLTVWATREVLQSSSDLL